jgi:hypothetical protein
MKRLAAISVVVLAIGVGSAVAQPPPPAGAPPPQYEAVPPPPGERYVWEPGHWHWNGVQYVWFRGHYVIRQAGYGHYVPGHWGWRPGLGRYVWVPAHWE